MEHTLRRRRESKGEGGGLVEKVEKMMGSVLGMLNLRYPWAPSRDIEQEVNR